MSLGPSPFQGVARTRTACLRPGFTPRSLAAGLLAVSLGIALAGCGSSSSPTAPTPNVPFSAVDLQVGTGPVAAAGQRLTVNYTGWLYDASQPENKGRQFDTTAGSQPFTFTLGAGQVIAGWDQGLAGMKVGGTRRLTIPPNLAYGSSGAGNGAIPPNATLIFDIALLSVQ